MGEGQFRIFADITERILDLFVRRAIEIGFTKTKPIDFNTGINASSGSAVTNASGNYSKAQLAPGNYVVEFQAMGFQRLLQKGVTVSVDKATRVDAQLATATRTIDETGVRTRAIQKKLKDVETLPDAAAAVIVEAPVEGAAEDLAELEEV